MELLEQLEARIGDILALQDRLKNENTRLREEIEADVAAKASLEGENRKLRDALAQEEAMRNEAVKRIDALLRKIQEHDSVA